MVDYTNIPLLSALKSKMRWHNANQRVISENIAHADTPGYKAKQLEKQDFSSFVDTMSAKVHQSPTSFSVPKFEPPKFVGMDGKVQSSNYRAQEQKGNEENPTGNSVVLEEEMIKMADNQMQYGMVTKLYTKNVAMLKMAIKGGGMS